MPLIGEQDAAAVVISESAHSLLLDDRCPPWVILDASAEPLGSADFRSAPNSDCKFKAVACVQGASSGL